MSSMKYIFVTGGVVSGLGKGITASSIGLLLKNAGLRVTSIKIDPYLNIDAGTMSPFEHGEVFVLDDGGECDLDLGNYERFLNVHLTRDHNITTGKVYQKVLNNERAGGYLGKTVQMVPHVSNCIQEWISEVAHRPVDGTGLVPQVCIVELGGTVGDIESMLFLEAIRLFRFNHPNCVCIVHVSLIPSLGNVGELKSKPTQHSMVNLRTAGIVPDCVVLRCPKVVPFPIIRKVSLFSTVSVERIVSVHDVSNIYEVPSLLLKNQLITSILNILSINKTNYADLKDIDLASINELAAKLSNQKVENTKSVTIGIVGKYTGLMDSYLSVTKALLSASLTINVKLNLVWIESTNLEDFLPAELLKEMTESKVESVAEDEEMATVAVSVAVPIIDDMKDTHNSSSGNNNNSNGNSNSNGNCDCVAGQNKTKSKSKDNGKSRDKSETGNENGSEHSSDENTDESSDDVVEVHQDVVHNMEYKTSPERFRRRSSMKAHKDAWAKLKKVDGILIPGGFGDRGIEGKILACRYARENQVPFLGICLGLQMAVIEYCRTKLGFRKANSTEFDAETEFPVVIFMPEGSKTKMGGTMRLGARICNLESGSLAAYLYGGRERVSERHRHRYEVNPAYIQQIERSGGLLFTGKDDNNERMEIIELPVDVHPYYFATQFHPEFLSGPLRPSPPFLGFMKAAAGILHSEASFKKSFNIKTK